MGILNITPDSFSDGGQFVDPAIALRARQADDRGRRRHHRHRRRIHPPLRRRQARDARGGVGAAATGAHGRGRSGHAGLDRHPQAGGRLLGARPGRAHHQRRLGPAARPQHGPRGRPARRAGRDHAQPLQGRAHHQHRVRYQRVLRLFPRHRGKGRHPARRDRARSRDRLRQDAGAEHGGDRQTRKIQALRPARSWSAPRASASSIRCRRRSR